MPIPLSWLQLSHNKIRLLIALAGISFSNLLMFLQLGFRSALFESSITFHKGIKGDIVLINTQSTNLFALKSFSKRRVYQALAVDGVKSSTSVYIDFGIWQNPVNSNTRQLMVIGIDPNDQVLNLPGFEESKHVTKLQDYILFDRLSRPEFGPIPKLYQQQGKVQTELNQNQVTVKGLFELGASFAADGNVITSYQTFFNIFPTRQPGLVDIGILHTEPGTNQDAIVSQLRQRLPNDVLVFTRKGFIQYEKQYWQNSTAIGFIFTLGAIIGLMVGGVIVYQILYTNVADHLPEYATLKAMGYPDTYFFQVLFQEALILAVLGFIPGVGISTLLYWIAQTTTNLPIYMTVTRAISVLILTLLMCNVSGAIAMRKLQQADPADIF